MRIWPIAKRGEKKLFGKFLLSYFLILLVPLLIGGYAYNRTVQVVREDAAELNLTVLEQSEEALNRLLSEIRDTVALLALDSEVLNLMITAEPDWSAESLYRFAQLQRNELSLLGTNQFFSRLFVYFRQSDALLSKDEIERLAQSRMSVGGEPFGEWLRGVIAEGRTNRYLRLENVRSGKSADNYLAYVSSLPEGNKKHVDGAIVILIREQAIAGLFQRLVSQEGAFARILDERAETIVSTSGVLPAEGEAGKLRSGSFVEIAGREVFLTSTLSPASGWTFQVGLPADAVFSKAEYIKRINWIFAAVALVAGLLIALLLAYRNSKPIADLVDVVKEFAGGEQGPGRRASEVDVIKSTFFAMMSDNRRMDVRMKQQLPMLQAACFERLLKSGFNSAREMNGYLEQAQLKLADGPVGAAVLKLHPYRAETAMAAAEEADAEYARVAKALSPYLAEGSYAHDLKDGKVALLFSFAPGDGRMHLDDMQALLERMQRLLLAESGLAASAGAGQLYDSATDLWRSYNEALQALDVQDPDDAMTIVFFADISLHSGHYYYPLDMEQKLIHTIKAGDPEGAERMLDHIGLENFQRRQLGVRRKKQLHAELEGTLLKLSEQLQATLSAGAAGGMAEQPSAGEGEQDFGQLRARLLAAAEGVKQQRSAKQNQLFQRIKAYVQDNYADNNLSLCGLAAHFQQAESSMSVFFKEQMGIPFSDHLEQLRLNDARALLRQSDLAIQDIALQVGYSNDKSFRRAFKRAYGVQPTSYRNGLEAAAADV